MKQLEYQHETTFELIAIDMSKSVTVSMKPTELPDNIQNNPKEIFKTRKLGKI